jgi:hypothetical protein
MNNLLYKFKKSIITLDQKLEPYGNVIETAVLIVILFAVFR